LLVIGIAWLAIGFRSRTAFALAFVITHGLAFLLSGGYGVDMNIFFNPLATSVIICGLAISDITSALVASRPGVLNSTVSMMFGLFFISIMIFVPGQLKRDRKQMQALPARESEFKSAVEFLQLRPGPAVCESPLLCYEAGKPFEFDTFSVRYQLRTGQLHEDDVLQLLRTHHFQSVQIEVHTDEQDLSDFDLLTSLASDQKELDKERRFSPSFLRELMSLYRLSKRTSQMAIFVPK
jgi:hypothetical protein